MEIRSPGSTKIVEEVYRVWLGLHVELNRRLN